MGQALPVITFVGEIIGALFAVDAVDSMLGSPVKKALDIDQPDPTLTLVQPNTYDVDVRADSDSRITASDRAQGMANYLRSLESLAPGYVDRNRSQLRSNYNKTIDKREEYYQNEEKRILS